jgi:hypothetical protein
MPKDKKETKEIITQKTQKEAGNWVEKAGKVAIVDQESLVAADAFAKDIKRFRLGIEKEFKPNVENAFKTYKELKALMDKYCVPLKNAEQQIKNEMLVYSRKMEQIRKEAAEKAQKEAEEAAKKERERLEKEAEEAAAKGNVEEFEEKKSQSEEVTVMDHMPITQPGPASPKGTSIKGKWMAEVTDFEELVKAVAEGKAPIDCIMVNQTYINQRARSDKKNLKIPGVRVWDEGSVSMRTAA